MLKLHSGRYLQLRVGVWIPPASCTLYQCSSFLICTAFRHASVLTQFAVKTL